MARAPVIPLHGTEARRQIAAHLIEEAELNGTTDQQRVFFRTMVVAPVWHGTLASEAAMLALYDESDRGCFPGDMCYRSDSRTLYRCIARNGLDLEDWFPIISAVTVVSGTPSDDVVPTEKAVKDYVDGLLGASNALVFKAVLDCSGNPNYPAADCGHVYVVSVAGKVGGAAGASVEAGDTLTCTHDGSAAGTQAAVGAYWVIVQANIDGAVTGPAAATVDHVVTFNHVSGKVVKDSGIAVADLVVKGLVTGSGLTMDVGLVGRYEAGVGVLQRITVGANLTLDGAGNLSAAGAAATLDPVDVWFFS
jgi:hypothetical protein